MARVQELLAGRYELLDELGRGGMGVVYRARDRVLDRIVAVKVLPLDRAQDPTFVARFEREALAAAALNHPNIVAVFDSGTDGETRFIVMEYIAGRNLAQLVREDGPRGVEQTVEIGVQVAAALAAAHRAGIVHRDIKPGNVMLDGHGRARVLDFGIARVLAGVTLTQTAMVLGSTAYLAPELISGQRAGAASDIYSLGCVLYELLAGKPPFTGELPAAILHQHNSSAPRALRRLNGSVPPALDALILRMLAKDPRRRPQDAGELAAALARSAGVDGGGGAGATRAGMVGALGGLGGLGAGEVEAAA
ncbi:MAG: serine/threonine protein kinase, partial [Acidobacteriota bacterium]|nr:serine/threonine protein kinase [Acidobacteriota bacterium]